MMSLVSLVTSEILRRYVLLIAILVLTFLAGVRDGVGTDYYAYLELWKAATPTFEGFNYGYTHFEPGFRLLISVLKVFSDSQIYFFTIIAAIPMFFLYMALAKYRLNHYVAIFIYVNVFYLAYIFNGMGQAIIISIFLYYFDDFLNLKTFKILVISILFAFIHKSAVLIIVAYVTYYICIKIENEIVLLISGVLGIVLYKLQIVSMLLNYISPQLAYTYMEIFSETTSFFQLITRTMILMVLYWFGKQLKNDIFYKNSLKVYIIGYLVYLVFYDYNVLATRINMLYRSVEILMFSYAILHSKNFITKISIFLIIAIIYGYSYLKVIYLDDFSYHSFLW